MKYALRDILVYVMLLIIGLRILFIDLFADINLLDLIADFLIIFFFLTSFYFGFISDVGDVRENLHYWSSILFAIGLIIVFILFLSSLVVINVYLSVLVIILGILFVLIAHNKFNKSYWNSCFCFLTLVLFLDFILCICLIVLNKCSIETSMDIIISMNSFELIVVMFARFILILYIIPELTNSFSLLITENKISKYFSKIAFKLFDLSSILDKNSLNLLEHKGRLFLCLDDYDSSMECFDKILNENPKHLNGLYFMAVNYLFLEEPEKALEFIDSLLELNVNESIIALKADILLDLEKFEEVIELINNFPDYDDANILFSGAVAFHFLQKYDLALEYCNKYLEKEENSLRGIWMKSTILIAMYDYDNALICIDNALKDFDDFKDNRIFPLLIKKGIVFLNKYEFDKSLDIFNQILDYDSISEHIYYDAMKNKGEVYYGMCDIEKAIDCFYKCKTKDYCPYSLIVILIRDKQFDEALSLINEFNNEHPYENYSFYSLKSEILFKLGQYDEAEINLDKSLEICDDNEALVRKASVLANVNRFDEALAICDSIPEEDINLDYSYYVKAKIYRNKGEIDKAIEFYNKALEIDSGFIEAKHALDKLLNQ